MDYLKQSGGSEVVAGILGALITTGLQFSKRWYTPTAMQAKAIVVLVSLAYGVGVAMYESKYDVASVISNIFAVVASSQTMYALVLNQTKLGEEISGKQDENKQQFKLPVKTEDVG